MGALSQVEKISEKYAISAEEFIRSGVIANLREKQRLLQIERFEILARYRASTIKEELSATNLKRDAFRHFGFIAIPLSSKIYGVANRLNLQAVPPYVGSPCGQIPTHQNLYPLLTESAFLQMPIPKPLSQMLPT